MFSYQYPDMALGPQNVKIIFTGEQFILPSNSSTIFVVRGPVFPVVFTPSSAAVDSLTTEEI